MEDEQMNYVIQKIRQNEEKTEELTIVLEGFHQSFDRLLGNIERVLEVGTIDQATKSVRQLDTHLGRIEKQMTTYQREEKEMLGQMSETLQDMGMILGHSEIKGGEKNRGAARSKRCVYSNDKLYCINETGLEMTSYHLKDGTSNVVVVPTMPIQSLGVCGDMVFYYTDEKIYRLGEASQCEIEEVVSYEITDYGIIYKNKVGNIKLYKYDGMQKSLAKRVNYFEIVGGRYLLFQGTKTELQFLDLEELDVEHPRSISL